MNELRRFHSPVYILLLFVSYLAFAPGGHAASQKPESAERYFKEGVSYYEAGQYQQAIEAYKRAVKINPEYADANYNLGMAYSSLGQYKEAIEAYKTAIRINHDYDAAYYNLGHAYSNLKQYDNSVKAFRQAIRKKPDYVEAYYGLGNAYLNSGDGEKAVHTFEEAIRLKPDNPYAYFNLGLLYFPAGPHAEAIDAFTQAILRDPRYAEAYYHRAYAYLYMGRGDSAASDAETYLNLKGWRAEHSQHMAIVAHFGHLQGRNAAGARKILDEAVERVDRSAWPYPAIEYLRRQISAKRLFSLADDEVKKNQARAYIGMNLSLAGQREAALGHLRWVKEHSRDEELERALAVTEIDRIKTSLTVSSK
ncbi:MAG TPA: tetratricopeptide repeat protein [Blastocatellia bacterium]|nr:tetratricopeptide repeat protein [Blastocatellia bacterium]